MNKILKDYLFYNFPYNKFFCEKVDFFLFKFYIKYHCNYLGKYLSFSLINLFFYINGF